MAKKDIWFPKIGESNWWNLRELFKNKVPVAVTASYLSTALSMKEKSAKVNIINPFKKIDLIDDNGSPTDLAYDWRDDKKYSEVCKILIKRIYPQELQDLFSSAEIDQEQLTSWFMNYCRCGTPAAKMYGAFYRLLLRADPTEAGKKQNSQISPSRKQRPDTKRAAKGDELKNPDRKPDNGKNPKSRGSKNSFRPSVNINIQIHISPEATPKQIDEIFKSMADHFSQLDFGDA